ncbi:MAG: cyclic pyranopterin monophosphate synthase MoaC, partial [Candidatus Altiarchaeota archaeon]|nr:cyclic pyranopterin monophosphate synthase MoaC [Candidatus Altiarchaeota archaeon]
MIDVTQKKEVVRIASATGEIRLKSETIEKIRNNATRKGDVLETARVSALLAVKKTPELIPHCHPIPITGVDVNFIILDEGV